MICGARTWAAPGHLVSCVRTDCDGQHRDSGIMRWTEASVVMQCDDGRMAYPTETEARALVASLQAQLDALDPDAAIAEAERRMLAAQAHFDDLSRIDYTCVAAWPAIIAAKTTAITVRDARAREWAELVASARFAKGGGA